MGCQCVIESENQFRKKKTWLELTYPIVDNGGHKAGPILIRDQLRIELELGARRCLHAVLHVRADVGLAGTLKVANCEAR